MVARWDRHFWLKVLIGLVFALLIVDVLALTYAVIPLAASQQKRAEPPTFSSRLTYSPVEQALILPTHDPRKPWVTRTPPPTPTPWLDPGANPRATASSDTRAGGQHHGRDARRKTHPSRGTRRRSLSRRN